MRDKYASEFPWDFKIVDVVSILTVYYELEITDRMVHLALHIGDGGSQIILQHKLQQGEEYRSIPANITIVNIHFGKLYKTPTVIC